MVRRVCFFDLVFFRITQQLHFDINLSNFIVQIMEGTNFYTRVLDDWRIKVVIQML